jgi:hypothetical protein
MNAYEIFIEMKKLPKGCIIEDPEGLIETDFKISKKILHTLGTNSDSVFFTRLSIKHLAEKELDGEHLFRSVQHIVSDPEIVYAGNFPNRFLISKDVLFRTGQKPHVIVVEINKKTSNIVVTGFIANKNYFKNLKLLWGTAFSPSQQPH